MRSVPYFSRWASLLLLSVALGWGQSLEESRRFVQGVSDEMAEVLRERYVADNNGQSVDPFDARLEALEAKRYPALRQVVLAENPTAAEVDATLMQFSLPVLGAPAGPVTALAGVTVAWNALFLDPINGQFMGYSRGEGPDPARIASNQSLAGSSNWSSFYPYPGDYDCSEEWDITTAPDASTAADWVVEELIQFGEYHQTNQFPNFELARLGIRWTDPVTGQRGRPDGWNLTELVGARTDASIAAEIKNAILNLDAGRVVFNFYVLLDSGRLTHMQKVLGVHALNPADLNGDPFFESEVPYAELLDGDIVSTSTDDEPFFRSQQISAPFQEIFTVGEASAIDLQGLGDYASLMRKLALKEVGRNEDGNLIVGDPNRRYLKAANRAYSYLRTIGNIQAMNQLKPLYSTTFSIMNQRMQMLELLADRALDEDFPSRIITAAKAKEQVEGAARAILPLKGNLSRDLRAIAVQFQGRGSNPADLSEPLKPNDDLAAQLEAVVERIGDALDLAVKSRVEPIITKFVVPFRNPQAPVISSDLSVAGNAGSPFTYTITASGLPTRFAAGGLPSGLTVNTSTGVISGTSQLGGTFQVRLAAFNQLGRGLANLTLSLNPTYEITSSLAATALEVGESFRYTIAMRFAAFSDLASRTPPVFGADNLPTGLRLDRKTGVISGRPTSPGTFTTTIQGLQGSIVLASGQKTFTVSPVTPPVINSSLAAATLTRGTPYTYTITATGSPTSFGAVNLPPGLRVNTRTGVISGTPNRAGVYLVTLKATKANSLVATSTKVLTVRAP